MPNDEEPRATRNTYQTINSMSPKKSARGSAVKPVASKAKKEQTLTKESDQAQRQLQSNPPLLNPERKKKRHKSIETPATEEYRQETPPSSLDTDPDERFNKKFGYLPPLDEEAAAIIAAIIENPDMAKDSYRTGPDNKLFTEGLEYRNVSLTESRAPDPYADCPESLPPVGGAVCETDEDMNSHGRLWTLDLANCDKGSNEALFQRTVMMSLIARHFFFYGGGSTQESVLDFSVEEAWSCPPMPTRAYEKLTKFLTQPKPDLAVCFKREALISDDLWRNMPHATKRLAFYENADEVGRTKIFHFFTIEAKKALISSDDIVGKRQSLNNASQSLHNMFEFLRDAGPEYENQFFAKVRFFSVVAGTEGLTIRNHYATRVSTDNGLITLNYPLRFEYREFYRILKEKFDRDAVLKTFKRILFGYGVNELRVLLQNAAEALMKKLNNDKKGMEEREDGNFYRYGQTVIARSRKQTPAPSETNMSGTAAQPSMQVLNSSGKRLRGQSEDNGQAYTRPQNQ